MVNQIQQNIKKLDSESIQDLCANQVIIDLATCLKELIENSLDANSTNIEITLVDNGKTMIEVKDNGHGISQKNLQILAQKGATSKLKDFEDMVKVTSFGFRGEALNSIANVADLIIITKTQDDEIGTKLSFQKFGTPPIQESFACQTGTIVQIKNMFYKIPVRKNEFLKNIKTHYNKCVNMVLEYAIIQINQKIILYHQEKNSNKQVIVNSGQEKDLLKKIHRVLASKYYEESHMIDFDISNGLPIQYQQVKARVWGAVSKKIESGSGSETKWMKKNLQFLYLNKRPINSLKKLNKIFQDIYRQYNNAGKYFYFLNFELPNEILDFNLSPDKREVVIQNEQELLEVFKGKLIQELEQVGSIQKLVISNESDNNPQQQINIQNDKQENGSAQKRKIKQLFDQKVIEYKQPKNQNILELQNENKGLKINKTPLSFLTNLQNNINSKDVQQYPKDLNKIQKPINSGFLQKLGKFTGQQHILQKTQKDNQNENNSELDCSIEESKQASTNIQNSQQKNIDEENLNLRYKKDNYIINNIKNDTNDLKFDYKENQYNNLEAKNINESTQNQEKEFNLEVMELNNFNKIQNVPQKSQNDNFQIIEQHKEKITEQKSGQINQYEDSINTEEKKQNLSQQLQNLDTQYIEQDLPEVMEDGIVQDEIDEERHFLKGETFKKEDFKNLKILGQFNKGFIICVLNQSQEIYVIDQHASDEKTNYEKFIYNSKFQSQLLMQPLCLQFQQLEVQQIEENKEIFEKNGFKFDIRQINLKDIYETSNEQKNLNLYEDQNEQQECQIKEVIIKSMPICQGIQFSLDDFMEVFQGIQNDEICKSNFRPFKIKRFYATKSCRMSKMIGDALNKQEMQQILNNLSQLKSPWNCPHGRPTMIKTPPTQFLVNKISKINDEYPEF